MDIMILDLIQTFRTTYFLLLNCTFWGENTVNCIRKRAEKSTAPALHVAKTVPCLRDQGFEPWTP